MAEEQKATEQQAEQADLEVEEEQADEVEGGRRLSRDPSGGNPDPQPAAGPRPQPL